MRAGIRLGIIGAGGAVRKLHWPVLEKMRRQIQVVAVASRLREKAVEVASLAGGATVYENYRELLTDSGVDAVLTAVPIESNARVLIDSVRAGKHVIAEKPIAATPAEGLEVLRACSETPKVVLIAENYRYRQDLLKAREILMSGAIGALFAFQLNVRFDLDAEVRRIWTERPWRRDATHPGGFVLDAGVHPVSFLRDLVGEITEVFAQTLNRHPDITGPDSLIMQMKLDNDAAGQYFACYTAKGKRETLLDLTVFGSRGTLEIRPGRVEWSRDREMVGSFKVPKADRGYPRQWRNFCNAIQSGEAVVSTPEKTFGDLLVIDAALRSAREQKPVKLTSKWRDVAGSQLS